MYCRILGVASLIMRMVRSVSSGGRGRHLLAHRPIDWNQYYCSSLSNSTLQRL